MKYLVIIDKGVLSYGAYVPDLPGRIAAAESEPEIRQLIKEAIRLHISGLREDGLPVPPASSSSGFVEVSVA
ncbi:MAG TPA: type II toxin-antitoxin system HicB family antitoxin [Thermoanaerobaculia bacterium]|jgi:predicted RNase H-like HicB family nuclease|nr:type II toxin-antitoxin system HicB family antitoxin [Thermoanaerobaculia bacterium]